MSKRGTATLGGRSNWGGDSAPRNSNGGRDSHVKVVKTDAKYGMLMWQSKLQEKLLKEQKAERKQQLLTKQTITSSSRRKSNDGSSTTSGDGNPPYFHRLHRTEPLRGGVGGGSGGENPAGSNSDNPTYYGGNNDEGAQLLPAAAAETRLNVEYDGPGESSPTKVTSPSHNITSNGRIPSGGGRAFNHVDNQTGTTTTTTTTLPRIGNATQQMPKISNSMSYDNLPSKNSNNVVTTSSPSSYVSPNLSFFGLLGFGSGGSGSGAPLRTPSGRLQTNLQGHPEIRYHQKDTRGFDQTLRYQMDKEGIQQYREALDKQVQEKERMKQRLRELKRRESNNVPIKIMSSHESAQKYLESYFSSNNSSKPRQSSSGMELAPIMRKFKSLPKLNTPLNSTDVTKLFVPSPRRGEQNSSYSCLSPEPEEIAKSLEEQLAEKQRIQQIQQENERLEAEKHFTTWDSFWGRPGHGAPILYSRNSRMGASTPSLVRNDLFKALHSNNAPRKQ